MDLNSLVSHNISTSQAFFVCNNGDGKEDFREENSCKTFGSGNQGSFEGKTNQDQAEKLLQYYGLLWENYSFGFEAPVRPYCVSDFHLSNDETDPVAKLSSGDWLDVPEVIML
ncbi:hypothetical protein V6N12_065978 [Hibiscus sabdariffa]|uniref:Uncharacterized protein n=1 Tax=Hibiscus sabdariffa TaxID=183260 RepID=A0ABR2ANE8_9ROSI